MSQDTIGRCPNGHDVCRVREVNGPDADDQLVVRATCHACGRPTARSIDRVLFADRRPRLTRLTCPACDVTFGFAQSALGGLIVHCHRCTESAFVRPRPPANASSGGDGDEAADVAASGGWIAR